MRFGLARAGRRGAGVFVAALVAGGAAAVAPVPVSAAPAAGPPGTVLVEVVTVKGSGCKKDSAEVSVSPDKEAFTVLYSTYVAQVGGDVKNRESRKNCKLDVRLSIPAGFTYAIAKADYRGFAFLERGASAVERAKYRFQGGGPDRAFAEHTFTGPFDDQWQTTDTEAALVFGPCGKTRTLSIDTELRVDAGSSDPETTSFIVMDSADGEINTVYHLAWRTCR